MEEKQQRRQLKTTNREDVVINLFYSSTHVLS
jgi:hypothetical protein